MRRKVEEGHNLRGSKIRQEVSNVGIRCTGKSKFGEPAVSVWPHPTIFHKAAAPE